MRSWWVTVWVMARSSYFLKIFIGGPVADFNAPSPTQVFPDTPVKTDWQSSDNLVSMDILYTLICNSFIASILISSTKYDLLLYSEPVFFQNFFIHKVQWTLGLCVCPHIYMHVGVDSARVHTLSFCICVWSAWIWQYFACTKCQLRYRSQ